jgi:hypothetical protein
MRKRKMKSGKYKIVRMFQRGGKRTIKSGLTKEAAMFHCKSPETSSSTATGSKARKLTAQRGPWFDGWDEE